MIFYPNKNFTKYELFNGILWLAGSCNYAPGKLNHIFSDHIIPKDIRGQFAMVWEGKDGWWMAQVDHLCTYPLWYSDNGNEVYSLWKDVTNNYSEIDTMFYAQRDILNGQMTVGTSCGRCGVQRIQPDHFVDKGTQDRYRYSINVNSKGPNINDWGDILKEAVRKNCNDGDVLFLSGGRDSTTIANVAKHLGIELDYVHVTRGKVNPDTQACKQFAYNLGLKVNYIDPWNYHDFYQEPDHWHDSSYSPKRQCLDVLGKKSGVSGEMGASESGSKKINTVLQMPDITIEQLTNIWITTLEARNESVAVPEIHSDYTQNNENHGLYKKAYREIIDHHERLYKELSDQTDDQEQLFKAVIMLHQQDHEAYRLFNYSQDIDYTWHHPFTDPDWFDIVMNAPVKKRKLHYHNREVYRIAARNWDWFDETAWQYGGPRGLKQ
jgi:hypothetical protein